MARSLAFPPLALTLLLALQCRAQMRIPAPLPRPREAPAAWVEQVMKSMSLEEKIGQMLQIRAYGDYTSLTAPDFLMVSAEIQRYHVGTVDLGARMRGPNLVKGTPQQVATITNALQQSSKLPLLVGGDFERGLASRLSDVPDFPFPMAFGAVGSTDTVERFAAVTAKEARAVGIQWAYAPVADVNSDPQNPIISTRSFGDNPAEVSRLVSAYIRGAHRAGLIVTAKHFPGEGNSSTDPHARITMINADREHLETVELPPFKAAIEEGVDAIMLAQAVVPALDPDREKVATTSQKIVAGVLRGELGFHGLVVTDALEMRGLTKLYPGDPDPSAHIALDAVKAGDDILMLPKNLQAAFTALVAAVRDGEIPESRIDESVKRILTVKAILGLNENRLVQLNQVDKAFADPRSFASAQEISDASITLVRSNDKVLPLARVNGPHTGTSKQLLQLSVPKPNVVVIAFSDSSRSPLGQAFEKELSVRLPGVHIFHSYNDHFGSDATVSELAPLIATADRVLIAAFVTHLATAQVSRAGRLINAIGFAGEGAQLFQDLASIAPAKTVVVALGTPYLIESNPEITNYICTYSLASTAEISAVKALFGEIHNNATLPINLPGVADRGTRVPWPSVHP